MKGLSDGQEASNVLQKAAAEEIVDLFVSTSAFTLTLKCHWYSGVALWETIKKKKIPLNPIYNLSDKLCVQGKQRWVLLHIKRHWTVSHIVIEMMSMDCNVCKFNIFSQEVNWQHWKYRKWLRCLPVFEPDVSSCLTRVGPSFGICGMVLPLMVSHHLSGSLNIVFF